MNILTEAQAVARLKKALAAHPQSARAWAAEHGLAYAYVMDVKDGRRPMSDTVAQAIGLVRVHGWKEPGEK